MYATCTIIYITKATIYEMRYALSIIGTTKKVFMGVTILCSKYISVFYGSLTRIKYAYRIRDMSFYLVFLSINIQKMMKCFGILAYKCSEIYTFERGF